MNTEEFLKLHKLNPEIIDTKEQSEIMLNNMKSALNGKVIDIPMIKTYLKTTGEVKPGSTAVVIDAGGTNYRCALAEYDGYDYYVTNVYKTAMPGTENPVTWDYFISFVADTITPYLDEADIIGFCFSYKAEITPELDGIVYAMDKEVVIKDCEGKYIGKSLIDELEKRGIKGKKCVVLNDTVSSLMGNPNNYNSQMYDDAIGLICGTGVNTCAKYNGTILNLECGMYSKMPRGDFDDAIDESSMYPGEKLMEKMCSGAYIGKIAKLALNLEGKVDGETVDKLSCGTDETQKKICTAIMERSARLVAANIMAIMKLTEKGKTKPVCVCAEGSLIEKSALYCKMLQKALNDNSGEYKAKVVIGHGTTLPGAAIAALLNA